MIQLGVDIGGTFTDLFAWEQSSGSGSTRLAKVLTTPEDPSVGVMQAIETAEIDPTKVEKIIHGTTIATNALIERSFPEPVLITTKGFRDVLEIGRQRRRHLYDPYQTKAAPLIARSRRFTVTEKLAADGETVVPLDREEGARLAREVAETGTKNVAIAFINAYRNGAHEREMRDLVLAEIPDAEIALSSETRPKVRELGRFMTTTIRAALLPVVGDYIAKLEQKLSQAGSRASLFIVKSNGGMMSGATAKQRPEELIASGPAGGVAAAGQLSRMLGLSSVVVTDVGGTSFEASLLEDGVGLVADESEIEWEQPVITPMLDIRSIGAGGGSIAWIDDGGSLRVGPHSAGASPGPACYGRGGDRPTVTDANLVLGRIDPTLGGKFTLDREAAETAIRSVAEPLDMSVLECAEGITRIVSESMAMAIRSVSTDRGRDPRDQVMAAFGGAGGLHAAQIAASVGIERVLVTPYAGVACAFGAITMDVRHDLESTYFAPLSELDPADLSQAYADLEDQVRDLLEADGVPRAQAEVERSGQMRYVGQSYDVTTPVLGGELTESAVESMKRDFNQVHQREYGVSSESFEVALVTIRVTGRGRDQDLGRDALAEALSTDVAAGQSREPRARDVYFDGTHHQVDVYQLEDLKTDQKLQGPTVIEQPDGVIVVPPDSQASVDRYHNVLISSNQ